jgi:hypothetical protein
MMMALKLFLSGMLGKLWSAIQKFLGSLNAQGWLGLVASAVLAFLYIHQAGETRHWKKQSAQFEKLYRADETSLKRIADQANSLKEKADRIAAEIRSKTDETNHRISGDAADILRGGPGKAVCHSTPASSGGSQPQGGAGNAPGLTLPPADSAAVPWIWLTERSEQADLNRAEVLAWREWYARLVAEWPKN